ncbi:MAG: ornithine cyclodeaminase family protein [Myxococcales bacterium]|nr:ornithine cyclodeaminase family protein [Myxococcales bacterium]
MLTAVLSRAEVSRHMQALHLLTEVRQAFGTRGLVGTEQSNFDAPSGNGPTVVRQGTHPRIPAWSLMVRAALPASSKSSGALLHLHDKESGQLLAVMDGGHLTALRASIVGALAADVLAKPEAKNVALLGTGPAVSSALKALRLVRTLERVTLYDFDLAASTEQALKLHQTLSARVRACESAEEAVSRADLVVLAGNVPLPTDSLAPGTHVTVMNAEKHLVAPLPPSLMERARCFCDDVRAPMPWAPKLMGELAQAISGAVPARTSADDVTVFFSIGPPFLDLVAAWHVYEGAKADETLTRLDLEA